MSKKKKGGNDKDSSKKIFLNTGFSDLKDETRYGVFSIIFFVIAVFFVLASLGKAGVAGNTAHEILGRFFGVGYFLLPTLLVLLSVSFLRSVRPHFAISSMVGSILFLLSGLGIIDLSAGGSAGGILGDIVAYPLLWLFDVYASFVFLLALFAISLVVMFDAMPKLTGLAFWRKDRNNVYDDEYEKIKESTEEVWAEEAEKTKSESVIAETFGLAKKKEKNDEEEILMRPRGLRVLGKEFVPPPISLLEKDKGKPGVGDIKANANIIKRTLQNFGIDVEMDEISIGPTVTRYALKPAEGVKLSRIVGLQNDLALALAAHPIRIEAPIPGKSLVGVEIPNSIKATVGLATLFSDEKFRNGGKPLLLALGRGVSGKSYFGNLAKMPHLLIAGATGSGKTCGKDTYVFSEKGILTFEELCPIPLNSEVNYSLRVATRDGVETTSKNYNNGTCDFYKITTSEGLSIEVTEEHPLWVMRGGTMRWQNGGSIQIGEYVAISRGSKLFGAEKQIDFTPATNKTNKAREIKIPTVMTKELGLFMGLLTADGGLTVKNRIVYTQANKEVLGIYMTLLKDLFGITAPIIAKSGASNKAKDIIIHSKHLKDFLTHLGVKPVGAREKEMPKSIRQSEPEIIKAFIQGLIRNDGHISVLKGLEITLATEKLLKQLQVALLNFGIVSTIHPKKVKNYAENNYWRLAIYGAEFATYAKEIGFLTDEEAYRAKRLLALRRNTNKNIIPTLAPILKKLYLMYREAFARLTNMGWHYQKDALVPKYAFRSLASYNSGLRNPSYEALGRILAFYEPLALSADYKKINRIHRDNFYWAKVAKIEKTEGIGYDFEVPGSNSFVGNGFVNHNSVTIHALTTSLLYRSSPEDLKFILIDPKRVELTLYNKIPHLLTPVITDAKKAILALKWAAKEMDRRYDILEAETVRDIESYHENVVVPAYKEYLEEKNGEDRNFTELPEKMPYIVIIIDELADIMATYPRELESAIVRLAQMSRAVGIHLILSTQRPSVNIITGLIKANIPSRIALQVSSQIDSRTILDTGGAEKLLGSGDMLYLSGDMSKPERMQSAYMSEDEVKRVVKYLAEQYKDAVPNEIELSSGAITPGKTIFEAALDDNESELEEDDALYEDAREAVIRAGKASSSYLQRKLKVGYARAARLIDMLEERAVIGPGEGSKPREVLIKDSGQLANSYDNGNNPQ